MKNLWVHTENPFATWIGDFSSVARRPAAILEFMQAALAAGVRHRMFDVVEAAEIGYRRDRDGSLSDVLTRLLERERVLDLFGFMGAAMLPGVSGSTVETALCYYDRAGVRVEGMVNNQGALLSSLELVPGSISNGMKRPYPAIRMTGERYTDVLDGQLVDRSSHSLPVVFRLCVHSDIWFPWVFGFAHPDRDLRRMFDNRELANCHTPRLNAFLKDVGAAARRAGGSFEFRPDESAAPAVDWIDDQGVLLDWMPSDGIMPPEALHPTAG